MIKKIFLPEFHKNKRVYSQTILGFYIKNSTITCIKTLAGKSENIIKYVTEEKINIKDQKEYKNLISNKIKNIVNNVGNFDQIYVSIPASKVIFNELELPFTDPDKIRMILDYEIESKLPFSINESVLDFIITKQNIQEKKSQILVAAIRNEDLKEILDIYQMAGIEPNKITIDLFAIYNLYKQIPEYNNIKNSTTIINIGSNSTRIALLQDSVLKLTRIIPQGINTIAQNIANKTNENLNNIKEKIINQGFNETQDQEFDKILQEYAISFFHDIQFTLNSFILKLNLNTSISKILLTGQYSNIKKLNNFCRNLLQIPCEQFDCEKIFSNKIFKNKVKTNVNNWNNFTIALGTTIPCSETLYFDLRRKEFENQSTNLALKQLKTSLILIVLMFAWLIINGSMEIHNLSNKIIEIEKQESTRLLKIIPKDMKLSKKIAFNSLINKADRVLSEKLEMWGPFEKSQVEPLLILQELTSIIDKKRFDVKIDTLSITEEDEKAKIEIEGFFRSKTGSQHYQYWEPLEKRFEESKFLELWDPAEDIETKTEEDKGIRFSAKLKLKE
jgi:type IV pilus assembly protein PilM